MNTANTYTFKPINDLIYSELKAQIDELNDYKKIKSEMYKANYNKTKIAQLEQQKIDIEGKIIFL